MWILAHKITRKLAPGVGALAVRPGSGPASLPERVLATMKPQAPAGRLSERVGKSQEAIDVVGRTMLVNGRQQRAHAAGPGLKVLVAQ